MHESFQTTPGPLPPEKRSKRLADFIKELKLIQEGIERHPSRDDSKNKRVLGLLEALRKKALSHQHKTDSER